MQNNTEWDWKEVKETGERYNVSQNKETSLKWDWKEFKETDVSFNVSQDEELTIKWTLEPNDINKIPDIVLIKATK